MEVVLKEKEIQLRVAQIIISELKLRDITVTTFDPDLDLVDEIGIDSMDLATIVLVLQDEYGIKLDEGDFPRLRSIRLIGEYIQERLEAKSEI